jgi:hypothetical protein
MTDLEQREAGSATAQWIVCEQTGRWAAAVRGTLARRGRGLPGGALRETRNLDECDRMLARWPASLVAIEVTPGNFPMRLRWLAGLESRFHRARAVVFSQLELAEADWALREAGAMAVARSFRGLPVVVVLAERHLARAPRPAVGITQEILAGLPWKT